MSQVAPAPNSNPVGGPEQGNNYHYHYYYYYHYHTYY